jgi:arabinose-5-phosphate isomerase
MITMCAADVMRPLENSALVATTSTVRETLYAMSHARCGSAIVVDDRKRLLGIFTDGDFRRWAEKDDKVLDLKMADVMTRSPISVAGDTLVVSVLKIIRERKIDDLVVVDGSNVVQGFIDSQDLPGLKMM